MIYAVVIEGDDEHVKIGKTKGETRNIRGLKNRLSGLQTRRRTGRVARAPRPCSQDFPTPHAASRLTRPMAAATTRSIGRRIVCLLGSAPVVRLTPCCRSASTRARGASPWPLPLLAPRVRVRPGRAIGAALGIRSTNGVNDHIKALRRKGALPTPSNTNVLADVGARIENGLTG